MYIYKITNTITGKFYIGQTKRALDKRLSSHFYEAKVRKYDMYLHKSIRKYGEKFFIIELLETCTSDNIYEREKYWIKTLGSVQPNGYNQHEGGRGGCLNPSDELREKLRKAKVGYVPWNKGLTKSDPRVALNGIKSGIANKGKPKSEAHKKAMRKAKEKCLFTEDTSQTSE